MPKFHNPNILRAVRRLLSYLLFDHLICAVCQAAICMVYYYDGANSSNGVQNDERSDRITIHSSPRIIENVHFSGLETEEVIRMDAGVEARD